MKLFQSVLNVASIIRTTVLGTILLAGSARAQQVAYDDAGNYLTSASWVSGANQGFGFTPWVILTNSTGDGLSQFHGTYVTAAPVFPAFANASITNVAGVTYTNVWGIFANGTNGINETTAYRGFASPLGTNTFKLQWGAKGAGSTKLSDNSTAHGWCGFSLRNGNATNSADDFQSGVRLYVYFLDGNIPSTIWVWDGVGDQVHSIPGTSFSDLGRNNITNAIEAEVTVGPDGNTYHLILKDCVVGKTLATYDSTLLGSGTIDSVALFCQETTGDQVYNRMQITVPRIPPTISNVLPADGSLYLDPSANNFSFEVDSFSSTVTSGLVNVYLNGVLKSGITYNTASPTNKLLANFTSPLAPDTFYYYTIAAQDANGDVVSNIYTFNTFRTNDLYIDAYDYNFVNGQFINSITPSNSYAGLFGTNGVDYFETDLAGTNNLYRPGDFPQVISLATDITGDPVDHAGLRLNGFTAYNIGFTDIGEWENYTRVVPVATNYSIYARAASAGGGQFEIEKLTNSVATTTNQPLIALGHVNVPNTGGSRVYSGQLIPLTDIYGNTVVMPLSGTNTIRTTAISSRGYNLEYLVVVAVTNSDVLRPYISTASPGPNASGVGLATPITFTIANRQTFVNAPTIKLFTNSVQVTSPYTFNTNASGAVVTYNLTANRQPNVTNSITVIFTDNTGANVTNSWIFVTGTVGGALGSGNWSGGGGLDLNWSTAANWIGGTPGPGFNASFTSLAATTTFMTNNIVSTNVTIQGLFYATNNSGYHTTLITDGVTLTVTNGTTGGATAIFQVGGAVGGDNVFNKPVTNTITGGNGTLLILGNPISSGLVNNLNFQVRQNESGTIPNLTTLDMSGLGTLVATVGKFYVAQGGSAANQTNSSACVYLAMTNIMTMTRPNPGQFEVGDSSGGPFVLPGSTLNFGITNAFYADTIRFGKNKATNNLIRFNPAFTNLTTPTFFLRGTNGGSTRTTTWTIADADTEATVPVFVSANVDLSGGKLNALVNTVIIGRGATTATDTGFAQGTLSITAGTLDVNTLQIGVQRAVNTASVTASVNISGTATLISTNIIVAQGAGGSGPTVGALNITNGTVRANIAGGGGSSTVNVNAGTLSVTRNAGTPTAPLTTLILTSAALHLNVDGNNTTAIVNATNVSASATIITIDSITNVTGTVTNHLISYTGSNPFAGLSLASLPSGYTGSLVNNSGSVDLALTVTAITPPPTIRVITLTGNQVVIGGTNNFGAGGTYTVFSSTNILVPLTNWDLLTTGAFDANGNFSSTNLTGTNNQRFYILRVP